ncbi:MAG TPA: multiheme c-type cytochrome, partial [Planctomycetia bacterium]|nr:multiheme c-type cytochrome [Planctomycetia bacterium]
MSGRRRGIAIGIALVAALAAAWLLHARRDQGLPEHFLMAAGTAPAGYVADAKCAECHAEIAAKFSNSGMGRSWHSWSEAPPIEDRSEGPKPAIQIGDLHYRAVIEKGRLFQSEFRKTADGGEFEIARKEVDYVLGSGGKGRAYVSAESGYLTTLPISWYSKKKIWDASPGYHVRNQRMARPIGPNCITCHDGLPAYRAGSGNSFAEPLPEGIGCQRCHGPGAAHVAHRESGAESADPLVALKSLSEDRKQDVCLQCHLQGDVVVYAPGKGEFDFRPGGRLSDWRTDGFNFAKQSDFLATGHGLRSIASACYKASRGRMTCVLCHDPHAAAGAVPRQAYNDKCIDCHRQSPCDRPIKAGEQALGGDCVSCHMPTREPTDISHAAATEHWIHRPG